MPIFIISVVFKGHFALTRLDAPVQEQQQARVPLTLLVVVQQQRSHSGQSGQSAQLERLLVDGWPVAGIWPAVGGGGVWPHERQ